MAALHAGRDRPDRDRPVLLHYDTKAGHSGGKPVSKQIDDTADQLQFLFWQLGMNMGAGGAVAGSSAGTAPAGH